ncbi:hypothetical protein M090_4159, partial [Parabacteroides distasonis str. 3776 Po2 i]
MSYLYWFFCLYNVRVYYSLLSCIAFLIASANLGCKCISF